MRKNVDLTTSHPTVPVLTKLKKFLLSFRSHHKMVVDKIEARARYSYNITPSSRFMSVALVLGIAYRNWLRRR